MKKRCPPNPLAGLDREANGWAGPQTLFDMQRLAVTIVHTHLKLHKLARGTSPPTRQGQTHCTSQITTRSYIQTNALFFPLFLSSPENLFNPQQKRLQHSEPHSGSLNKQRLTSPHAGLTPPTCHSQHEIQGCCRFRVASYQYKEQQWSVPPSKDCSMCPALVQSTSTAFTVNNAFQNPSSLDGNNI